MSLTNKDIYDGYRGIVFPCFLSELRAAFSYWVIRQSYNEKVYDLLPSALSSFTTYAGDSFDSNESVIPITWDALSKIINEDEFKAIPEIRALNEVDGDFIGLEALARNVFYMVLREVITGGIYEIHDQQAI